MVSLQMQCVCAQVGIVHMGMVYYCVVNMNYALWTIHVYVLAVLPFLAVRRWLTALNAAMEECRQKGLKCGESVYQTTCTNNPSQMTD